MIAKFISLLRRLFRSGHEKRKTIEELVPDRSSPESSTIAPNVHVHIVYPDPPEPLNEAEMINPETYRVGKYFPLYEMLLSETAKRNGIDNTPGQVEIDNLKRLCAKVLDPMREALGPVHVTSGYRCRALNMLIGGQPNSQHIDGNAADLWVSGHTLDQVFAWAREHLEFDQLIREFPPNGWVHISYAEPLRHDVLLITKDGTVRI